MPARDDIVWSRLPGDLPATACADLLDNASQDASALGDALGEPWAEAYCGWLREAVDHPELAGPTRAALANEALAILGLSKHIDAITRLGASRRARSTSVDVALALARWTDAELRITAEAAQRLFDDPASARNRLASIGKAAGTLGHELRNPLGVIESSLYLLERRDDLDPKAARHLEKIARQARTCHRIIEDLMHLARNAPPRLESIDVSDAFALALEEAALPAVVMCRIEAPPGLRVQADSGLLQRALVNLLRNANSAMRGRGAVQLGILEADDSLALYVRDHGPGFDAALLDNAFDPLATTSGIGLGLALVESIMRRHDGRATAENLPDGGARVSLHFPNRDTRAAT